MPVRGCLTVLLLALAIASPAAHASSLVFLKPDGNVWLANPDGSGQYQVTLDGTPGDPYGAPSQADDGTIVATRGSDHNSKLVRMRQNGEVLSSFTPAVTFAFGLFDAEISPDGTEVVYQTGFFGNPSCTGPQGPGDPTTNCVAGFVTAATGPADAGVTLKGGIEPSWVSADRLLFEVGNSLWTHDIGDPAPDPWFNAGGPSDPELTRDGRRVAHAATAVLTGRELLVVRETTGDPLNDEPGPGVLGPGCQLSMPAGGSFNDPTWSPDGNAVAWEESDLNELTPPGPGHGIWVWNLGTGSFANCAGLPAPPAAAIIPGATNPDWGPADVNPGPRPTPAVTAPVTTPVTTQVVPPQPIVCCAPRPRNVAPVLTGAALAATSVLAARGAILNVRLSERATLTVTISQRVRGRRLRNGRCSPRARTGRRCTATVVRRRLTLAGRAGPNRLRLRLAGLAPGAYTARIVARDSQGAVSRAAALSFRIQAPRGPRR